MPLIKSKSPKAFSKNVEMEMHAGKPQKQSLAIAYSVKRKAGKKMAKGGMVNESAASEHRPMPEEHDKDAAMVSRNSGNKAPKNDSWTDKSTEAQAIKNNGRAVKPIKRPSMVPTNAFSTRLYNAEGDLEDSASPGPYGAQPSREDDEEGADRKGPDTPALHMKKMANGGSVEEDADHQANKHHEAVDHEYGGSTEEDEAPDMDPADSDDMEKGPSKSEFMAAHFAAGGEITHRSETLDHEEPIMEHGFKSDEEALDHHASMVAAIMAKRRKFAKGGEILSHGSMDTHESADQADVSRNADEDANEEDQASFNALRKENYSESAGLSQLDSPEDSNEDGRTIEHDKHDMLDEIRQKMKRRIR